MKRSLLDWLRRRLDTQVKVLIKNSSWVFTANAVRTVSAFARSIIIARALGVELFGTYVLIVALVETLRQFFDANISTAIIKFGADFQDTHRNDKLVALVKAALAVSAVLAVSFILVALIVISVAYDKIIPYEGLGLYVTLFAGASSGGFFSNISAGLLRLYMKFRLTSLIDITLALTELAIIAVVLTIWPRELVPFLVAIIASRTFAVLLLNAAAAYELWAELRTVRAAPITLIRPEARTIGAFVLSNSGSRTLRTIMDRGDVLLLGALTDATQVGLYEIAKKLAYTLLRFTDPLVMSVFPQIAKLLASRQISEVRRMIRKLSTAIASGALVVYAVATVVASTVITAVYGSDFGPATIPFLIILVESCAGATTFWLLPAIQSAGKVHSRLAATAFALLIGLAVALLVIPDYGASGLAFAASLAKITIMLWLGTVMLRYFKHG